MKSLKLGLPTGGIIIALIFTPTYAQAGAITASDTQATRFTPQTMTTQAQPPEAPLAPGQQTMFPMVHAPNVPPAAPTLPLESGPVQVPANLPQANANRNNSTLDLLRQLIQGLGPNGVTKDGLPTSFTNFDTFEYDNNHIWNSGRKGLANTGNGLCTQKNDSRPQVQRGYCQELYKILSDPGSCANREMKKIIAMADRGSFGQMHDFCSTYPKLSDQQKPELFLQVLAGLAEMESGWDPGEIEPGWHNKKGQQMQGRGTFQIGVKDRMQDPDCQELNETTIFQPKINMRCGACIALKYAALDHTMGQGSEDYDDKKPDTARGIARYYGPFRDGQAHKRGAVAAGANVWCVANTSDNPGNMLAATGAPGSSTSTAVQRTTAATATAK